MTYKEICEKYGVSESALDSRINREGWARSRKNVARKVQEKRKEKFVEKLSQIPDGCIADKTEIMRYLTGVMRGDIHERVTDKDGNETEIPVRISDRTIAAEKLARMLGADKAIDNERLKLEREKLEAERAALDKVSEMAQEKAADPFIEALTKAAQNLSSGGDKPEGTVEEQDDVK